MLETKISPREYQKEITKTCVKDNCLVVLPTGTGKTLIAIMVTMEIMKKNPLKKVLFLAPTKPLAEQQLESFKENLGELYAGMTLFTGSVKPEKRKELWNKNEIIFSTPQCVDGETLIFTEDGPVKISEFFKKFKFKEEKYLEGKGKIAEIKEKILGYDGQKIGFLEASRAWKLPGKGLIKLKTEIGNTLLCTKNHPLLTITPNGEIIWKEASQLNRGESIASIKEIDIEEKQLEITNLISSSESLKIANKALIKELIKKLKENNIKTSPYSRYLNNFMPIKLFLELSKKVGFNYNSLTLTDNYGKSNPIKIPKYLDNKIAYIIGGMLGDGHLGIREKHGGEVVFSELDRNSICDEMKNAIKDAFGIEMKKSPKGIIAYNSALSYVLSLFGIPKGNKSKIISVPQFMFFADKNSIRGFIKGIFDTDGSASKYNASISSASKKFIEELKWLFLRIGILGNIEKRENKGGTIKGRKIKHSKIFTFRFSGRENLQKFLTVNPDKDKCKKLVETLNNTKRPGTRSKEILPISKLMKRIRKLNKGKIDYYKFSCLSIDNLRKITENLEGKEISKLKELLDLPIRWVKIKEKKEYNEKKEVYDLTIKNHHNFIANCLINHNCIANDIKKGLYNLRDLGLLIEDEAHRCVRNYDYNIVAQKTISQAENPRIIGLTASPGSDEKKIKEICKNLSIKEVELRTRESADVKEYLQELKFEKVEVELPKKFLEARAMLNEMYETYLQSLRKNNLVFGTVSKFTIIELQKKLMNQISRGYKNFSSYRAVSDCSMAIKLSHAIELLETQTISSTHSYLKEIYNQAEKKKSKGVERLVNKPIFNMTFALVNQLHLQGEEHPKIREIIHIIKEEIENKKDSKIIIFAQFRETAKTISENLNRLKDVKSKVFIGQAKKQTSSGLSQKEQKEIIEKFKNKEINVIVSTSIGEEGLDIPEVDSVIFYEPTSSAIRSIQRRGRTARLQEGKLIILITKNTKDQRSHYASRSREKKMSKSIESIKKELKQKNTQKRLF